MRFVLATMLVVSTLTVLAVPASADHDHWCDADTLVCRAAGPAVHVLTSLDPEVTWCEERIGESNPQGPQVWLRYPCDVDV